MRVVDRFDVKYRGFLADLREHDAQGVVWFYLLPIEKPPERDGKIAFAHDARHRRGFSFVEYLLAEFEWSYLRRYYNDNVITQGLV